MKTILACIDFSDTSVPVLDAAARLADTIGAKIVLMYVEPYQQDYIGVDIGYMPTDLPVQIDQRIGFQELHKRARRLETPDRPVETVYVEGPVVQQILEQAEAHDADILVMGSHGHGALYHLIMGSVTEGVLHRIKRPVLVVPAPEKDNASES